jgi:predicted O-methyltransferase YrrM
MHKYSEYINESILESWFSAKTMADSQLQQLISTNNFEKIKPNFKQISNRLFRTDNPYHSYERKNLCKAMSYPAHIGDKTINAIITLLNGVPKFGVEVGSFIGSSATILGNMMKQNDGVLMCVDTWCGDINMWLLDNFAHTMQKPDGNPKIYDRFMTNMIDNDLTQNVIPFRVSSIVAARTLKVLNYEIDFVYLDSAHEAGETFMELSLYFDILKPGGIIFGDDYVGFPAVKQDLDLFCKVTNSNLLFTGDGDTWILQKK